MSATMKAVDPTHAARLKAAQEALALDNERMADKFGVGLRTFVSWKYGERNMSKPALKILEQLEAKAKK